MSNWADLSQGLPNTTKGRLDIVNSTGKLRLGTFGRGVYETDLINSNPAYQKPAPKQPIIQVEGCGGEITLYANTPEAADSYHWFKNDVEIAVTNDPQHTTSEEGMWSVRIKKGPLFSYASEQENVQAGAPDVTDPVFVNCPADQTVMLDENGNGQISVIDPSFSDNCGIEEESLSINFLDGAVGENGETQFFYSNLSPGNAFTYLISGVGRVEFIYMIVDPSGNKTTCTSIITSKALEGPCIDDLEMPTLTNCPPDAIVNLDNNQVDITIVAPIFEDNCAIASKTLTLEYSGGSTDPNGNTNTTINNFDNGQSLSVKAIGTGQVKATFVAVDPTNNMNSCATTITIEGESNNVIFTLDERCIVPGLRNSFPVRIRNFNDVGAFGFDLQVAQNSGLTFIGLENKNLPNAAFNVLPNGDLRIAWDESLGENLSLTDNSILFDVVIEASNDFNLPQLVTGTEIVILQNNIVESGLVNPTNICLGIGVTPSGTVSNLLDKNIENIRVEINRNSSTIEQTTTDGNGQYSLPLTNDTDRVRPVKNDEVRRGITITDVARIRRHFLQKLFLDNDYKILAADVNKDGIVNVKDIAFTNQVFLQKIDEFPNNTAWRVVPKDLDISVNPIDINLPDYIALNQPGLDYNNLDFYIVKTGDVDHSAFLQKSNPINNRSIKIEVDMPDTKASQNGLIALPINAKGQENISALSITFRYNPDHLELETIIAPNLHGFGKSSYYDQGGLVTIGWDHPQGEQINLPDVLLGLSFKDRKNKDAMSKIKILTSHFYDINLNEIKSKVRNGSLTYASTQSLNSENKVLINAYPNPFNEVLNIDYDLDIAQPFTIKLTDSSGKLLRSIQIDEAKVNDRIVIEDIYPQGLIFVEIKGRTFLYNQKVIKI